MPPLFLFSAGFTSTSGVITTDSQEPGTHVLDHNSPADPIVLDRHGAFNTTRVERLAATTTATPDSTAAPHGGLTLSVTSARKQHDSGGSPSSSTAAGVNVTTMRGNTKIEDEEELFASHGVYEEYLAYDCRPPEPEEHGGEGTSALVKGVSLSPGVVASSSTDGKREGNNKAVAAMSRPSTPQLALREEIMDRLFDELWERLTPDLLFIADREGGSESLKPAESSNGFRDSME